MSRHRIDMTTTDDAGMLVGRADVCVRLDG
jgi:hypothetical protein